MEPQAGWYDDGTGVVRYWDGSQWTAHVLPSEPTPEPAPAPQPTPAHAVVRAPVSSDPAPVTPDASVGRFRVASRLRAVGLVLTVFLLVHSVVPWSWLWFLESLPSYLVARHGRGWWFYPWTMVGISDYELWGGPVWWLLIVSLALGFAARWAWFVIAVVIAQAAVSIVNAHASLGWYGRSLANVHWTYLANEATLALLLAAILALAVAMAVTSRGLAAAKRAERDRHIVAVRQARTDEAVAAWEADFVRVYGTAPAPGMALTAVGHRAPSTDGFAVASLICGLLLMSLLAVVFGHVALSRMRTSGAGGRGVAVAGLWLGYLGLGISAAIWTFVLIASAS